MTTKTDCELLELAAKAAGIEGEYRRIHQTYGDEWIDGIKRPYQPIFWNPLTDDGDALRLATELSLNVFHTGGSCFALESDSDGPESSCSYRDCGGKHEATRRAIVRAAAVIGETL